jgi:hypothetical protein
MATLSALDWAVADRSCSEWTQRYDASHHRE